MITQEKLVQILVKLLEKTKAGKVHWEAESGIPSGFHVIFADSILLQITHVSPTAEPDYIKVVLRPRSAEPFELKVEDGAPNYPMLYELHQEARRAASGWDEALAVIEGELDSDDEIGHAPSGF